MYQASARRYESCVSPELYEATAETHRVSDHGRVYWNGKNWLVGEAFVGLDVVLEENPEKGAAAETKLVRFANLKLGVIGDPDFGRLRPTASAARSESKPCAANTAALSA